MGKPRHSAVYYKAKNNAGLSAHYKRSDFENRKDFKENTRAETARQNMVTNKGWIKGAYSDYKSPNSWDFHADHRVALKEAFDSGGWNMSQAMKKSFGKDQSNIVMAQGKINVDKSAKSIDKWLPKKNVLQYLEGREATKKAYNLTMTASETKTFIKEVGRKPDVKLGNKDKYCSSCHTLPVGKSIKMYKKKRNES